MGARVNAAGSVAVAVAVARVIVTVFRDTGQLVVRISVMEYMGCLH